MTELCEVGANGEAAQLPQDLMAEQSVLGAMMLSPAAITDVVACIRSEDFYRPANQYVFDVILALHGRGEPADAVTVATELDRRKLLRRIGGAPYLHTLISTVPTATNASSYADIVAEKAKLRRAAAAGTRITELAYAGADATEILDHIQAEVQALVDGHRLADEPKSTTWDAIDLTEVLSGTWAPLMPGVGVRGDGVGLFYPGKMHSVASESGAGKTWFVLAVAFQELKAGNTVVFIDFEDDEGGVVGRLLTMGADKDWIRDRFKYLRPNESLTTGGLALESLNKSLALRPTLVVIDGVTEAMVMHGLNPMDNRDVAVFMSRLPRLIAASGAATVCLDHVPKDEENRGRYAIGGVHKLNAIDGAAYVLENREPIGINLAGHSSIHISKDRPGQLLKHAQPRRKDGLHPFAELIITSHDDTYAEFEIAPLEERTEDFRPTVLMKRIYEVLSGGPLSSQNAVIDSVIGRKEWKIKALKCLIADGIVSEEKPYRVLRPFLGDGEAEK